MLQARAFAAAVCAGVASAVFYGVLRRIRRLTHANAVLTGALDLVFWLAAAVLTAAAGALCGVEGLRLYMLLGAALGFLLWEVGIRRATLAALHALRRKE